MKVVSLAPRSRRFSSCSLPRLRSQPIHRRWLSFHTRRRWSSRNLSPPGAGACRRLRRATASTAVCNSASSLSVVSLAASGQSESKRELDFSADAGEMMDFHSLDLLDDGFGPGQQGRHHHQGAQIEPALHRGASGRGPARLRTGASPPG